MERQLDATAARMLERALREQGIDVAVRAHDDGDPRRPRRAARRHGDRGRPRDRRRRRRARDRRSRAASGLRGRPRRARRRLAAHEHPRRLGGRRVRRAPRRDRRPRRARARDGARRRRRHRRRARRLPARPGRRPGSRSRASTSSAPASSRATTRSSRSTPAPATTAARSTAASELVGQIVLGDAAAPRWRAARPDRLRLQRRHAQRDPGVLVDSTASCARRAPRPAAAAARRRSQALLDEAAEVGFQAVQLEGQKAIEVVMRGPVEVRGAGGQQARARARRRVAPRVCSSLWVA